MANEFGVVDIFAGPGGLAEGFSRAVVGDHLPFRVELSIENDPAAHKTLRLRSFIHQFRHETPQFYIDMLNAGRVPDEDELAELYPEEWGEAERIAKCLTLSEENRPQVEELLDPIKKEYEDRTILIGGPPCQVYSLVGRSRNLRNHLYKGDEDHRHHLYREYIHILDYLRPAVFVMENVKGMLSSRLGSERIFPLVRRDLESIGQEDDSGYRLVTVSGVHHGGQRSLFPEPDHRDFIVRSEQYGVPQKRHRIIIVGIRSDIAADLPPHVLEFGLLPDKMDEHAHVEAVLRNMPLLRSGLSKEGDSVAAWIEAVREAFSVLENLALDGSFQSELNDVREEFELRASDYARSATEPNGAGVSIASDLRDWLIPDGLNTLPNNETRGHIREDLARYLFASVWARAYGASPKMEQFPDALAPAHRNWKSGHFSDRFRVQRWDDASTTITSHISKDGHYFIHPDPAQCRSLTVREAARLQTFPDDYFFMGNRTQQYVQVGNAVPPYLAKQIAESLGTSLANRRSVRPTAPVMRK